MMTETSTQIEQRCQRCNAKIIDSDRYCYQCGAEIAFSQLPSMPQEEQIIFETRPSFYGIAVTYFWTVLLSLFTAALIGYFGGQFSLVLLCAAICLGFPFYRQLQHKRVNYKLTTVGIKIQSGLISTTIHNIPLRSVRDITTRAPFSKRLFGAGDVIIDSAVIAGKISLRNVSDPRKFSDLILAQLHRRN